MGDLTYGGCDQGSVRSTALNRYLRPLALVCTKLDAVIDRLGSIREDCSYTALIVESEIKRNIEVNKPETQAATPELSKELIAYHSMYDSLCLAYETGEPERLFEVFENIHDQREQNHD